MKPFQKVLAAFLAIVVIASAAGCAPISLSKEWSYKYSDDVLKQEYSIGMYVYSLYQAYNQAKTYAEKSKDYKDNEPFMDIEITDDDNKKAVAKDWIKDEADKIMMNLIALDYLCAKDGATWDEAQMEEAKKTAQNYWDMGPYASYGYYQPMKAQLEQYGISEESYFLSLTAANVKQSALFAKLYNKGGLEEVSDKELEKYFVKNYVDYSYIPVHLYTSDTDKDGNSTSKKFSDKKTKSTIAALEDLAKAINNGSTTYKKASETAAKDLKAATADEVKNKVSTLDNLKSDNADIYNAVKKLGTGKASVVKVGTDGDSPMAYLVVKNDINKDTKDYMSGDNRNSVLTAMKSKDFTDMLEKTGNELKKSKALSKNEGAINKYDPGMFFVKAEETTAAADDSDSSDSES